RIRELRGDLGCLRFSIERIASSDESTLVWVLVAVRQDDAELTPLGNLLNARDRFAALKIHGGRRLTDHMDRIQLDDGGETTLIARLLRYIRAFIDQGTTDDARDRRVKLHLLQSEFGKLHIGTRLVGLGRREIPLCFCLQQLYLGGNVAGPEGLRVL